ncbi:MAG: HDOD domain-containing protein [bacterium]
MFEEDLTKKIKALTRNITSLPTLPTILAQVMELLNDPNSSVVKIGNVISADPPSAARIIRLINSAYYGIRQNIPNIHQAIILLGINTVKDLLLGCHIFNAFPNNKGSFDRQKFWEHSISCGVASKMMGKRYHFHIKGDLFVVGLLHDIGKIIIDQYLHSQLEQINEVMKKNNVLGFEAEKIVLGVDHSHIGKWLAESWNLPTHVKISISLHHNPSLVSGNDILPTIVHIANYLSHTIKNESVQPLDDSAWGSMQKIDPNFSSKHIDELLKKLTTELEESSIFLNILKGR